MKPADQLASFVAEALRAGHTREEITQVLQQAGWSDVEITKALAAWADMPFVPPVPRPHPSVSARDAYLYALTAIAMTVVVWHVLWLGFNLIEMLFAEERYVPFDTLHSVAALLVFGPVLALTQLRIRAAMQADAGKRRSGLRRWFGYSALLISTLILIGVLVAAINALLNGELTLKFLAEAALVAVVSSTLFFYSKRELSNSDPQG